MGLLPRGFYIHKIKRFNMERHGHGYYVRLNYTPIGMRLDRAQDILDAQVWADVQRYMPVDTGALRSQTNAININARGRVYLYPPASDYGHYQHEGVVYVDPVSKKAAYYSPKYGFYSRKGVQKIKSVRLLKYSQPRARRYWGLYAIDHHADEWVRLVKKVLSKQ